MSRYLDLFVSEARQHLADAERDVGSFGASETDAEAVNNLFRHFHSLKGMAASMGFAGIASLSHAAEDLFDEIRKVPSLALRSGVKEVVLDALDIVSSQIERASKGDMELPDTDALIARIRGLMENVRRTDDSGRHHRAAAAAGRVDPSRPAPAEPEAPAPSPPATVFRI